MAKSRNIKNAGSDLNNNLERDFNDFIRSALLELSEDKGPDSISPIDTGFFASSWTASTQRPRPNQPRENHAPWSNIEPSMEGRPADDYIVSPRFIPNAKFNFKIFSKVYIGNRSEYAASALASPRSRIAKYSGTLRPLVNAIFTDKAKIAVGAKQFKGGQGGIGQFADPDREFVDYTNL